MNTFQQFLEEKCEEQESAIINLDIQELIDYGEKYGKYVAYETLSDIGDKITTQILKAHDELKK